MMIITAILVVGVFCLPTLDARRSSTPPILKLSMWTRAGYCAVHKCAAKDGHVMLWSIRSFMVVQEDGEPIHDKCSTVHFKPSSIARIEHQLRRYWPSFTSKPAEEVWRQSFEEHGVCALSYVQDIRSVQDYFTKAIVLFERNNIGELFDISGYVPSNQKALRRKQLNSVIGGDALPVEFICEGERNGSEILQQVNFCFEPATSRRIGCPHTIDDDEPKMACKSKRIWYLKASNSAGGGDDDEEATPASDDEGTAMPDDGKSAAEKLFSAAYMWMLLVAMVLWLSATYC